MSISDSAIHLPFVFVDYASSSLDALANDVIAVKKPNPADLSQSIIWCESRAQIHSIKLSLISAGQAAGIQHILLPTIVTLQDWVWQHASLELPIISETNKHLLLVEAIRQSPTLFQTNNAWPLAKELVTLFNECTLAQVPLHEGEQSLREALQSSYQFSATNTTNISRESEIVYRLWQAYREQLDARGWIDPVDYYSSWLMNTDIQFSFDTKHDYYLSGKHRLSTAEVKFLHQLSQTRPVSIY